MNEDLKNHSGGRRGRPKGQYNLRKLFLIITEGKTEFNYLNALKVFIGPTIDILLIIGADSKLSLVEKTTQYRRSKQKEGVYDGKIDVTWVVLDRDIDSQNKTDKNLFNQALTLAQREDIQVAYSNDAFELWLLLHFIYLDTAQTRKALVAKLKRRLGGQYKKNDPKIYDTIHARNGDRDKAIKRATRLLEEKFDIDPADANPSTKVHLLVKDLLRQFNRCG